MRPYFDDEFWEDDDPPCCCCRCRRRVSVRKRSFSEEVTMVMALLFTIGWVYMVVTHLPAALVTLSALL